MFHKRHGPPGGAPATLISHPLKDAASRPVVQITRYHGDELTEQESNAMPTRLDPPVSGEVLWINLDGLSNADMLRELGDRFNVHPLALEDVLNTGQRPKIEHTADYLFCVAQATYPVDTQTFHVEQVSIFLGDGFLLTMQEEGGYDVFEPVRHRLRAARGMIRNSGADYLAYSLLDSIVDHYFPVLENIGAALEELEEQLSEQATRDIIGKLHEHRRNLAHIRRFIWPLREVISGMLHDGGTFIKEPTRVFLRDCYDHCIQLMDLVESYKELTNSLTELYHSAVGLRTNEIMRVLTVVTAIFIPLTFIVGIYGMNFESRAPDGSLMPLNMPELHHPHGYPIVLAVMLLIAICQLLIFRKLRWL